MSKYKRKITAAQALDILPEDGSSLESNGYITIDDEDMYDQSREDVPNAGQDDLDDRVESDEDNVIRTAHWVAAEDF